MVTTTQILALGFDSQSVQDFLKASIIPIVILFIGLLVMLRARGQDHRSAIAMVGIALIGLFVVGLAVGTNATDLGAWLVDLATGTGQPPSGGR